MELGRTFRSVSLTQVWAEQRNFPFSADECVNNLLSSMHDDAQTSRSGNNKPNKWGGRPSFLGREYRKDCSVNMSVCVVYTIHLFSYKLLKSQCERIKNLFFLVPSMWSALCYLLMPRYRCMTAGKSYRTQSLLPNFSYHWSPLSLWAGGTQGPRSW